mgnify:CR=1 FL=1
MDGTTGVEIHTMEIHTMAKTHPIRLAEEV